MATIYDVARRAGVSPATVSRVFNGHGVSDDKARAVREAAAELDFTPSRAARSLRRQASEVVALVIPDIENPYYTELARGVEDVASEAGFSVVLCNTDSQVEKEADYLRIAVSENMAGVVLAAASAESSLDPVLSAGRPVVAVDRRVNYSVDSVVIANREAARGATEDLLRRGYRRIAFLSGPLEIETARDRAAGWRDAMQRLAPEVDLTELLVPATFRVEGGREAMDRLLARADPPEAVVAGNNLLGVGALQILGERALSTADVGVAIVGSLPFTTLAPRAVTVVRLPAREMGVAAARMLLERISGDDRPVRTLVLEGAVHPQEVA